MSSSIDQLLTIACSKGASDLHIKAGSFPFVRVNGELTTLEAAGRRLARNDEALELLDATLALAPGFPFADGTKGRVLRALSRLDESVRSSATRLMLPLKG